MKTILKVGVIGGGAMGQGIASLVAQSGIPVVIKEINEELAQKALENIFSKIDKAAERGKIMSDKADMAKSLISASSDEIFLTNVDLVIEAVFEDMEVKKKVFHSLDFVVPKRAIFATNTSSLSITEMASATERPKQVVGMHFFNPPITMPLVEIISGKETDEETVETVEQFARDLSKTTIRVKECPGFLVNRLLMPYLNEAVLLLSETTLKPEEIDRQAVEFGWRMGPFMLLDYLGIDIAAHVARILFQGFGERAKPAPLMEILANEKRYGVKTSAGFYVYQPDAGFEDIMKIVEKNFPQRRPLSPEEGFMRMMRGMANEALLCLDEGISTAEDIETGCRLGIGFPFTKLGPLHWAEKEMGRKIFTEEEKW